MTRCLRLVIELVVALALLVAVVLVVWRVGEKARFVTWPVAAFTTLAWVVAMVALRVGLQRPWFLAAGVVPGLMLSYFLPVAPLAVVAGVLVCLALLAVNTGGTLAGMPFTVAVAMVLLVVLQGPVVECGESTLSTNSGPWWVPSPSNWSSSSSSGVSGRSSGKTQVGSHDYVYTCEGARLTSFDRAR